MDDLRANPADLRIMHVEGNSTTPTLHDGDIVLVDTGRRIPTPAGILVLHDGIGWSPSASSTSQTATRRVSRSCPTMLAIPLRAARRGNEHRW
jgi:phage repressor protein C with HTH and peptisase S24 domain